MAMSFSIPPLFRRRDKKPSETKCYPTLASICQPRLSSSSKSYQSSNSAHAISPYEELEDNDFYLYIRSNHDSLFKKSCVVCIPCSRQLHGLALNRNLIDAHSFSRSPYYQGQYQSASGKVISIEQEAVITISGYGQSKPIRILNEELIYLESKKVRVLLIDGLLEGGISTSTNNQLINGNELSIHPPPSFKNCGDDLTVLESISNGPKMIEGLRTFVREFTETYVYLPGYTDHTVEKICQMCSKAAQELCIHDASTTKANVWTDNEKEILKERIENLVMRMLHNKIWAQSLPGFLSIEDSNLEVLSIAYCRDTFALGKYGIIGQLASMPRKYLNGAIACLQQLDADHECYRMISHCYDEEDEDEESADPTTAVINLKPALTPVEKLKCVRDTLDRISQAAEKYLLDMSMVNEAHEACITTDQLIPLAMFVLIHARIPRLASMIFYMEYFSFEVGKNSDLNFALVTFKAAVEFLKDDPLGLSEVCSISSMSSTSSTILRITPHARKRSSSLSTNVTSPLSTPSCSAAMIGSRSMNQRPMSPPCYIEGGPDSLSPPISNLREVRHRKSVSADLCSLARHATGHTELSVMDHNRITSPLNRRESPNLIVRSRIVLPKTPPPPEPLPSQRRRSSDWTASDQLHENWQPDGKSMYPHPLVSTTSPTISAREKFMASYDRPPAYDACQSAITYMSRRGASRPTSMVIGSPPPKIINVQNNPGINERYPRRPRSFCLESGMVQKEHSIGDFLSGLQNLGGDVVGERTGEIRSLQRW